MKKTIASLCVILVVLGAAAWLKRTDIILALAKYQSSQRYADIGPARDVSWQQGPTAAAESMSPPIQRIKRMAFRSRDRGHLRDAILLHLATLALHPRPVSAPTAS